MEMAAAQMVALRQADCLVPDSSRSLVRKQSEDE